MKTLGFRPTLWPTVITAGAVCLAVGLGAWQIQRLFWKGDLIAYRTAQSSAPVIPLPSRFDRKVHEFRRVRVTGTLLHDKEMYLAARSLRGNPGYHVIAPMRLADRSHMLIDRGWVPLDKKDPATRARAQVAGTVTIEGYLRVPPERGWAVPDNEPAKNFWFFVDITAMADHAKLVRIHPYFVEAGPAKNPGVYPLGGQTRLDLPNNHLLYVIQWFSLALAAIVIYVLYHWRRERSEIADADG